MTTTRCLPLLPLLYYRDGGHAEQPYHHEVSALAPPTPIFPDRLRPRLLSLARRETPQPTPSPPLCEIDAHFSKLACDFPDHSSTRARVASDRRDNVIPSLSTSGRPIVPSGCVTPTTVVDTSSRVAPEPGYRANVYPLPRECVCQVCFHVRNATHGGYSTAVKSPVFPWTRRTIGTRPSHETRYPEAISVPR